MARILLATPEGQQVVELRAHNSLGRHPSNSIQLLDKIVSKEHCIIEKRGDVYVLRDLGSLNGTYVNGERVAGEQGMRHGDDIALGATRARFDDGSGASVAPPPPAGSPIGAGTGPTSGWQPAAPVFSQPAHTPPHGPASERGGAPFSGARAPEPQPYTYPPQQQIAPPAWARAASGNPAAPGTAVIGAVAEMPSLPPVNATRVDVNDRARAIGTQIAATQKGFLPYDHLAGNSQQLAADYERLRLSHELSREIALERDLATLLNKILLTIFKFVRADRGVIFLCDPNGELRPGASLRRDGTDAPITVSSTIMDHVIKERATVLTHDAAMD
ncbi:MAG TPA: FHA domain-containing protein, partial [Polyangiaceae bacterium]|nr:FHA domain-containing protein [Polyangiaceae bacterium]